MRIGLAAVLYFAAVFGAGFLLGPIRVLLLEPRLGSLLALLCETPLLLAAMILASRWAPGVARLKPDAGRLAAVGCVALILQQVADLTVGVALRGIGVEAQMARFLTAEGAVYAALLLIFAAMPLLVSCLRRSGAETHSSGSVVNRSG